MLDYKITFYENLTIQGNIQCNIRWKGLFNFISHTMATFESSSNSPTFPPVYDILATVYNRPRCYCNI